MSKKLTSVLQYTHVSNGTSCMHETNLIMDTSPIIPDLFYEVLDLHIEILVHRTETKSSDTLMIGIN